MAFTSYISYLEYEQLGGKVPEESFNVLERKAQRLLDYITFDRIPECPEIPDEVKEVLTELVNREYSFDQQVEAGDTIESYANSVEKLTYRVKSEDEHNDEMVKYAMKILPDYLTARSVKFDVKKYLQPENNDPEQA
jgi:hypothetical protein